MAVSLGKSLVPQLNIPSLMPAEISQLGFHGILGATVFEIIFIISFVEMFTVYSSWGLAFVFTVNDVTNATK